VRFWMFVLGYGVVFLVALSLTPPEANTLEFYATSAQIVPVLVLVLAVELRLFAMRPSRGGWRASASGPILMFLRVSEVFAMVPLITGDLSDGDPQWVVGGLATGFAGIAVVALVPPTGPTGVADSDRERP
jgi:hypothetical protein